MELSMHHHALRTVALAPWAWPRHPRGCLAVATAVHSDDVVAYTELAAVKNIFQYFSVKKRLGVAFLDVFHCQCPEFVIWLCRRRAPWLGALAKEIA
jgi:hypothetical protein